MPAIIPHGQRSKVIFHNTTDIQLVVQTLQGLLMKKFMICISHGTSRITSLSPNQWEAGTSSSDNAGYACQRDAIIIAFFYEKSQDKNDPLVLSKRTSLYPRSKERGFKLGNFDNGKYQEETYSCGMSESQITRIVQIVLILGFLFF